MMSSVKLPAGSYDVTIKENRIVAVNRIHDDDELLGIEWAISEIKDAFKHSGKIDGTYGVADPDELEELLDLLARLLGNDAVATWKDRIQS